MSTAQPPSSPHPPEVTVVLDIQPRQFCAGSGHSQEPPTITLAVTSHADRPVTIFTWPSIFNLRLSQERRNFTCLDLTTHEWMDVELTKGPRRPGYSRTASGRDDRHFTTLEPDTPTTFTRRFGLACWPTEGIHAVVPGHKYRYAVSEGEKIRWWRYGRKADVMGPAGQPTSLGDADGPPIAVDNIEAIDFEMLAE